jgi:proliferating cell nuclear antigen
MTDADVADRVAAMQDAAADALAEGDTVFHGIIAAGTLQQFVDTLTPLVDEARVHINDDGLVVRAVDPANVCMYAPLTLAPRAFEAFEAPGAATVGVNLQTLDERLGRANSDDLVAVSVDMATRMLELSYRSIDLEVALIDPDAIRSDPDTPDDLALPNTVVIEGQQFDDAVAVAEMVSDHIRIAGRPDDRAVEFSGSGDTDSGRMTLSDEDVLDADVPERASSLFSTEYFEELADPMPDDADVTVRFGDEFPVRLSWAACEGALTAEAMCAPRIEDQ